MPRIHALPPDVVAKIAAGEVIERPASVVKELLENSLDAGATRVDVELEQGGAELIRIADNGHGIAEEDLALAFAPHATSKLRDADDLFAIETMGFRGEALASVGGVAQVRLQSRTPERPSGAEVQCHGGKLGDPRPWNGSPGTRIEVRHLFYNVPVRKKFLKGASTEIGHVTEAVTRLALANPTLHVTLKHNGKLLYDIPATAGLPDRVAAFFGDDVRDKLLLVETDPAPYSLWGYAADPACDRGHARLQYFFVNGRWFRDRSLSHALQEAYRGLVMVGRYPVAFLYLTVPPDMVDVNAHPTKAEVRFRENSAVYSLVRSAVKARLLKADLVPTLTVPKPAPEPEREAWALSPPPPPARVEGLFTPPPRAESGPKPWELPDLAPADAPDPLLRQRPVLPPPLRFGEGGRGGEVAFKATSPPPAPLSEAERGEPEPPPTAYPDFPTPPVLPPGAALQVHDSYIVVETPEGMLVVDQHALHERILFEQLRRRVRDGKLEVQRLLIPEPVELPAAQAAAVVAVAEELRELGLEVADFGGGTLMLSSYPRLLNRRPPHEILRGVIDHVLTQDRPPSRDALLDHLLATMACKAAVKAGDRLTPDELTHLLALRHLADDSHHCPHGRPTQLLFSRQQLDKQFGRV